MTDEEVADIKLAETWVGENGFGSDCNNINSVEANREMVNAFLAGFKAGRPEWHDLRKDPTDLPERVSSTSPISKTVVNQIGTPCYYHYGLKCWHNWSFIKITTPIAWCEVPTFTDKE